MAQQCHVKAKVLQAQWVSMTNFNHQSSHDQKTIPHPSCRCWPIFGAPGARPHSCVTSRGSLPLPAPYPDASDDMSQGMGTSGLQHPVPPTPQLFHPLAAQGALPISCLTLSPSTQPTTKSGRTCHRWLSAAPAPPWLGWGGGTGWVPACHSPQDMDIRCRQTPSLTGSPMPNHQLCQPQTHALEKGLGPAPQPLPFLPA